jgi:hypothetical protein
VETAYLIVLIGAMFAIAALCWWAVAKLSAGPR